MCLVRPWLPRLCSMCQIRDVKRKEKTALGNAPRGPKRVVREPRMQTRSRLYLKPTRGEPKQEDLGSSRVLYEDCRRKER